MYNEVGTAIFAARRGERVALGGIADLLRAPRERNVGAWVVDLPVTTEAANAAGREIWGYPKFVTRIDFSMEAREFASTVYDPQGREICVLAGDLGVGVPIPPMSLMTFTQLAGELVRTHVDVRAPTRLHPRSGLRLRLGDSEHDMTTHLRMLGLEGAKPRAVVSTRHFQSKLWAGSRVL